MSDQKKEKHISGCMLHSFGWIKNGFTWTKDKEVITYDGCDWMQDGKKITFVDEIKNTPEGV